MHGLGSDTPARPEEIDRPQRTDHDRSGAEGAGGGGDGGSGKMGQGGGTGDFMGGANATTARHGAAHGRATGHVIEVSGAATGVHAAADPTREEHGLPSVLRGSRATLEQSLALLRRSAETLAHCDLVLHRSALLHFLSTGSSRRELHQPVHRPPAFKPAAEAAASGEPDACGPPMCTDYD